jgi:hypothetical protein
MRFLTFGVALLLLVTPAALTADLAKIDRTIRKEPAYHSKPKYFLLAFGPEAKKRVWVVLDGEDFYVDRNGNGDLTETGEHGKVPGEVEIEGDGKAPITLNINPPNSEGVLVCWPMSRGDTSSARQSSQPAAPRTHRSTTSRAPCASTSSRRASWSAAVPMIIWR